MLYCTFRRFYTPDAPPTGGTTPPDAGGSDATDISLPDDIDDLVYLADRVADHWIAAPAITMIGMTSAAFRALVTAMKLKLGSRKSIGGSRESQTQALEALNLQADTGVAKVKTYLIGKYEDEEVAKAQWPRFGIVREGDNYRLPRDMQDRLGALDLMIAATGEDGFDTKEYGPTFWTEFKTQYNAALDNAANTDSGVSGALATLDLQEEQVRDVLTGLRFILRGNYLKTYRDVWRAWGFQAEDF